MNVRLTKEQKIKIANSSDVFEIMRRVLMRENRIGRNKEHFWVIGLNIKHRILYIELVSLGSIDKAIVNPMEVYHLAVEKKSPRVILVHNHPSGELAPSKHDFELTRSLQKGGKLLNITVVDHFIITEDKYLSFKDEGLLKQKSSK